jgi:hypothetical protein
MSVSRALAQRQDRLSFALAQRIARRGSYRGGSGNSGAKQPVTRKSIVTALQQQSVFDGYTIAAQ